jgi:hypothetical protein
MAALNMFSFVVLQIFQIELFKFILDASLKAYSCRILLRGVGGVAVVPYGALFQLFQKKMFSSLGIEWRRNMAVNAFWCKGGIIGDILNVSDKSCCCPRKKGSLVAF